MVREGHEQGGVGVWEGLLWWLLLVVPAAPLTVSARQSKKEFYDREVEGSERRYRQLKERQELEYTARLQDEAKRLKSLQEKDCRRRMQELKGDRKEVRVQGSAGSPSSATSSLGTISPGCWGEAPPFTHRRSSGSCSSSRRNSTQPCRELSRSTRRR